MANNEWQYALPPRGTKLHAAQHGPTGRDPLSASMLPVHDILTLHSYTGGAALDVFGLSAANTPAKLTPSSNPGATAALLCSTAAGGLSLVTLTSPTVYGSADANGDLTLEGTSHATKTTSYVILQPTGGNVGIGTTGPTHLLTIAQAAGTLGLQLTSTATGQTATNGFTVVIDNATKDVYLNQRENAAMRFWANGAEAITVLPSRTGLIPNGGLHIGGISDPGNDNLLVDGTGVITGGFGCNSKTAQTAYASGGAVTTAAGTYGFASDAQRASLTTLVSNIRASLVANGIMS